MGVLPVNTKGESKADDRYEGARMRRGGCGYRRAEQVKMRDGRRCFEMLPVQSADI